ncbi:MAG: hypothetical protein ACREXR_16530, partial [Gammaproteobacteria bacterium]
METQHVTSSLFDSSNQPGNGDIKTTHTGDHGVRSAVRPVLWRFFGLFGRFSRVAAASRFQCGGQRYQPLPSRSALAESILKRVHEQRGRQRRLHSSWLARHGAVGVNWLD